MKRPTAVLSVAITACILFAHSVEAEVTRLSDPVAITDDTEIFGAPLDADARPTSLEALLDNPADFVGSAIRVDARISQVCQKRHLESQR